MSIRNFFNLFIFVYSLATTLSITPKPSIHLDDFLLNYKTDANLEIVHEPNHSVTRTDQSVKDWTWIVYMSAVNDLRIFASRNIKQMATVGSNKHINIVVHLDIKDQTGKKITRRYFVEKNKIIQTNSEDNPLPAMDSGDEKTLISCCQWAISNYPAHHYGIIFWNHGMGPIDPVIGKIINPTELFYFNPHTQMLELDRSVGFLDLVCTSRGTLRGICWDDETGNYLTNQKLIRGLSTICTELLHGRKINLVGFDACCMASVEIADLISPYAEVMVGSQEVELGTGWNYQRVLEPFEHKSIDKHALASHIVAQYEHEYVAITGDYTQSAFNLDQIIHLKHNIHTVANNLLEAAARQTSNSVFNVIKASCHKLHCTHFDEPSYKDLAHFYRNLLNNLRHITLQTPYETSSFIKSLEQSIRNGLEIIDNVVFANVCGKNLENAYGISIYLPHRSVHASYPQIPFTLNNSWLDLLYTVLHN